MSGRFLVSIAILALLSAAVGAGLAVLLQPDDDPVQTSAQVAVVATTNAADAMDQPEPAPAEPSSEETDQAAAQSVAPVEDAEQQPAPQQQPPTEDQQPTVERESGDVQSVQAAETEQNEPDEDRQDQLERETQQEAPVDAEAHLVIITMPNLVTQGEALSLTVESDEASAVAATIAGRSWNLLDTEPGVWWAVVAIPRDAATGSTDVVVDLYGPGGSWLRSISSSIIVLASAAPFEEVILGGTGIAADPAEIQRDHDVRFVHNVLVSGPARWRTPWLLPVQGEVTGVFGAKRSYDGVLSDGWHHGHDIAADHGDPIVAPAPGTVVWTGELIIHGMGVILDHGAGVYSGYWHMSLIAVREGMEVAPGDWLGNIGTTGLSTGPHLHWEVIIQGVDVDPVQWLGEDQAPLPPAPPESGQTADTLN
ncbi:MAG: peptidoglycan DD-metalloendopeptidase family protein [Chloroflexota bacterium]|nr:peptidoglycan DD-metalloendopeptidase family protein [Chloroflexota bacterium]MDE2896187.1 peptidoglycan DD-metalloendopeptidase family protein [Chloroflexota bacterium]